MKLVYKENNWKGGAITSPTELIILEETTMKPDFSARADWSEVERFWYAKGYGWVRWDHWAPPENDWGNYNSIKDGCEKSRFCKAVIQYRTTTNNSPSYQSVCPDPNGIKY